MARTIIGAYSALFDDTGAAGANNVAYWQNNNILLVANVTKTFQHNLNALLPNNPLVTTPAIDNIISVEWIHYYGYGTDGGGNYAMGMTNGMIVADPTVNTATVTFFDVPALSAIFGLLRIKLIHTIGR